MKDISSLLTRALDGAWARHEVLANNVANLETPGYARQDLDFRQALQKAVGTGPKLLTTNPNHLSAKSLLDSRTYSISNPSGAKDGVDMDKEMSEVSANALYYQAISSQLNARLSLLRKAISEGRR